MTALRIYFGSSGVPARFKLRHTQHGLLAFPSLVLSHAYHLATLNMALTQGCIPVEPSPDSSREVLLPLPSLNTRPLQFPRPAAPALPRAATTATAAGAAPPPCQLLGCNGDWAAAAEVTPGRGRGAGPAPESTAENRSPVGDLLRGGGEAAFPPLLPWLLTGGSWEPVRGGHPVRPLSGEARPGSPGAGRGGVPAPSPRPCGMHRGGPGRRRHSQVS